MRTSVLSALSVLLLGAVPCIAQPTVPLTTTAFTKTAFATATLHDGGFTGIDAEAFGEMVFGSNGRSLRWAGAPELVILMPVMQYQPGESTVYAATSEQLTDGEANQLANDLTTALSLMTGGVFATFAGVRREFVEAGATAQVLRQGQIVVGRFRGVSDAMQTIGLGGRKVRSDGTIASGAMMLDAEYDRDSSMRPLLRAHELGHALGYNHVAARASIMNARIGAELTDFDRQVAAVTFQRVRPIAAGHAPMRVSR